MNTGNNFKKFYAVEAVISQRTVEMLWRQSCGSLGLVGLGEIFQKNYVAGKLLSINLIGGLKKVYGMIFFYFTRRN